MSVAADARRHVTRAIDDTWAHAVQRGSSCVTVDRFLNCVYAQWRSGYKQYLDGCGILGLSTVAAAADAVAKDESKWPVWARDTASAVRAEIDLDLYCWARALALFHPGVNDLLAATERECAPRNRESFITWIGRWLDFVARSPWLREIEKVYGTSATTSSSPLVYTPCLVEMQSSTSDGSKSKWYLLAFPNRIVLMLARTHLVAMFMKLGGGKHCQWVTLRSANSNGSVHHFCAPPSTLEWCQRYYTQVLKKMDDDTSALNYKRTVMWADADTSDMECEHVCNILRRVL